MTMWPWRFAISVAGPGKAEAETVRFAVPVR
jgi:hypothetical protein